MNTHKEIVEQNLVFRSLPANEMEKLLNSAIIRRYKKGEYLVHIGDIWPYIFMVTQGSINASKESIEGRSLVVTNFHKGDIFWGLAFFQENMPMPVALEANEASQIYLWSTATLQPLLEKEGMVAWQLARLMILRMARASEILEEIAFQPVGSRLAKLLLDLSQGKSTESVTRSLTLDEMAARIGSTREMVCRFLHRFADDGLIDITRTEYRITDQDRLLELMQAAK